MAISSMSGINMYQVLEYKNKYAPVFRNGKSLFVVEVSDPISMPSELQKIEKI